LRHFFTKSNRFLVGALFFSLSALASASENFSGPSNYCPQGWGRGRQVDRGLYQLTGTEVQIGETQHLFPELPDPAPPYVTEAGQIEIFGSAPYYIRYPNWNEFLKGGCYERLTLNLQEPQGLPYSAEYSQPWDLRKFKVKTSAFSANEIILGGAMSAPAGKPFPTWPDDNYTRRVYVFRLDQALQWVRDWFPIIGQVLADPSIGWIGHSYGGNLLQEQTPAGEIDFSSPQPIAFFYEKVTALMQNGSATAPYKTELFATPIRSLNQPPFSDGPEIPILSIGETPYPATKRTIGGFLVEGPRPSQIQIEGQNFFIIAFSSGDFPTDSYTINYLWSHSLFGPYYPFLNENKTDLLDWGEGLKRKYNLSWVGRATFFQTPSGSYQMLFHGVRKEILPENDYSEWPSRYNLWDFFRCIFKINVEWRLDAQGAPVLIF
jgi:hypothetical protein